VTACSADAAPTAESARLMFGTRGLHEERRLPISVFWARLDFIAADLRRGSPHLKRAFPHPRGLANLHTGSPNRAAADSMEADVFTDPDCSRIAIGRDLVRQAHFVSPDHPTYLPCGPDPGSRTVSSGTGFLCPLWSAVRRSRAITGGP